MYRFISFPITAIAVVCVGTACTRTAASGGSSGSGAWTNNGATACQRFLTRDVVSAILSNPEGASKALSVQACTFESQDSGGTISITLTVAGPAEFEAYQKYLVDPKPLAGVGDKASQSITGIDAVKGTDRSCSIDAGGAPGSLHVTGPELGQKLGAICNELFALP